MNSFRQFAPLVEELSNGEAGISQDIIYPDRCLDSLTSMGRAGYWPSPDDTRQELDEFAPAGKYDSIFVLWPQTNLKTGRQIHSGGWGLGVRATDWSNGATYATVANARRAIWDVPVVGEVWLHEWLHGVCRYFEERGYTMPHGDADGGGRHGYVQSATTGWTEYYRDLMTGQVSEDGAHLGITAEAWRERLARVE
ncbi:MAG TPA: hypothetical protein VJT09_05555 [Pyrinomonadaceae bacterium]|nr:hypothetical protein [Pyrinomonadaceae bacterium]